MLERLQKVLSAAGVASRREAEQLISQGKVAVNGEIVRDQGHKVDRERDHIAVEGRGIPREVPRLYLVLHKPAGCVTTRDDPHATTTVMDVVLPILQDRMGKDNPALNGLHPVGRLDAQTEGLLLLTNDGEFTHAITHPSHQVPKLYKAEVRGLLTAEAKDKLESGVPLFGKRTMPARVRNLRIDRAKQVSGLELELREGRNQQVRRMLQAVGFPVTRLKRVAIGPVTLERLKPGQFRFLTSAEVATLMKIAENPGLQDEPRPTAPAPPRPESRRNSDRSGDRRSVVTYGYKPPAREPREATPTDGEPSFTPRPDGGRPRGPRPDGPRPGSRDRNAPPPRPGFPGGPSRGRGTDRPGYGTRPDFAPRGGDRPGFDRSGPDRPRDDRPRDDRPRGDRPRGDRPDDGRGYGGGRGPGRPDDFRGPRPGRPEGGDNRFGSRPPSGDRGFDRGGPDRGDRPSSGGYDRPDRGPRPGGPRDDSRPGGFQGRNPREGGRDAGPRGGDPRGDQRPRDDRPRDDRPREGRPDTREGFRGGFGGGRPQGSRPEGGDFRGGAGGGRGYGGPSRPGGDRGYGGPSRPGGDRPRGERPGGDRSGGRGPNPGGPRGGDRPSGPRDRGPRGDR